MGVVEEERRRVVEVVLQTAAMEQPQEVGLTEVPRNFDRNLCQGSQHVHIQLAHREGVGEAAAAVARVQLLLEAHHARHIDHCSYRQKPTDV